MVFFEEFFFSKKLHGYFFFQIKLCKNNAKMYKWFVITIALCMGKNVSTYSSVYTLHHVVACSFQASFCSAVINNSYSSMDPKINLFLTTYMIVQLIRKVLKDDCIFQKTTFYPMKVWYSCCMT